MIVNKVQKSVLTWTYASADCKSCRQK